MRQALTDGPANLAGAVRDVRSRSRQHYVRSRCGRPGSTSAPRRCAGRGQPRSRSHSPRWGAPAPPTLARVPLSSAVGIDAMCSRSCFDATTPPPSMGAMTASTEHAHTNKHGGTRARCVLTRTRGSGGVRDGGQSSRKRGRPPSAVSRVCVCRRGTGGSLRPRSTEAADGTRRERLRPDGASDNVVSLSREARDEGEAEGE
jgi:hypothetical protein